MADKWVHFVLFAVFSFLWLSSFPPEKRWQGLLLAFVVSLVFGWLVEELQGLLTFLGRSRSVKDMIADGIGGLLGVIIYYILILRLQANKTKREPKHDLPE